MSTERRYLMLGGDIGPLQVLSEIQDHKGPWRAFRGGKAHCSMQLFMQEHCKNAQYSPINYIQKELTPTKICKLY